MATSTWKFNIIDTCVICSRQIDACDHMFSSSFWIDHEIGPSMLDPAIVPPTKIQVDTSYGAIMCSCFPNVVGIWEKVTVSVQAPGNIASATAKLKLLRSVANNNIPPPTSNAPLLHPGCIACGGDSSKHKLGCPTQRKK